MVSNLRVMSQMRPHHQHVGRTDDGGAPGFRTAMNRTMLPDDVAIPWCLSRRRTAVTRELVRSCADDTSIADEVSGSDPTLSSHDCVGLNLIIRANDYWALDYHIGSNLCPRPNFGTRIDNCARMNHSELIECIPAVCRNIRRNESVR